MVKMPNVERSEQKSEHAGEQQHSNIWLVIPMLPCNLVCVEDLTSLAGFSLSAPPFHRAKGKADAITRLLHNKMKNDYSTCTRNKLL
eukprot:CAMPEP_0198209390 /NCGR_PEP_ID=MMETSP1445-20131203/15436_1 /TAXON_ID=36898 /ORGANISM="Pyramimonas sp., Strain CCMP2087" /LENGTH=86 /DNA_ID=CAMNT_0043883157 /DNA_START=626 /DNA_END=886 /DNA_ORIENTATION=+